MCGIFGFISSNAAPPGYERFIRDAFISGTVRGDHGSGMIAVNAGGEDDHYAAAVSGYDFVSYKAHDHIFQKVPKAVAVIGHNRFATAGEHIADHCHPFSFGDVVGVHNGSVLQYTINKITDFAHPVDSARIYHAINEAGDNPLEVLKKLYTGAYALVWYNRADKAIYMARNTDRPLHIIAGNTGLMFASEAGMLTWLGGRSNLYTAQHSISSLDVHTLYKFPLDNLAEVSATEYTPELPVYQRYNNAPYQPTGYWPGYADDEDDYGYNRVYDWRHGAQQRNLNLPMQGQGRAKPSAKPYMVHFSLTQLESQHPQLYGEIPQIRDNLQYTPEDKFTPVIDIAIFGEAESINGYTGFYGVMMKPGTNIPISAVPVFIETPTGKLKGNHKQLMAEAAAVVPEDCCAAIVQCSIDRYVATADGFMFIWAKAEEQPKADRHIHSFAEKVVQFCHDTVTGKDLISLNGPQVQTIWESVLYNGLYQAG